MRFSCLFFAFAEERKKKGGFFSFLFFSFVLLPTLSPNNNNFEKTDSPDNDTPNNSEPFLLAVSVLDQYDSMACAAEGEGSLPAPGTPEEFERSEIALYGAEVALEGGDAAGALARVEACLLALEDPGKAQALPWPPIAKASSSGATAAVADAVAKPNIGAAPPARDLR